MLLHRVSPPRNEARFYLVIVAPSLFDPFAVWRIWGRIGGAQQRKISICASEIEAQMLANKLIERKLKRGYHYADQNAAAEEKEIRSQSYLPQTKNRPAETGLSTLQPGLFNLG